MGRLVVTLVVLVTLLLAVANVVVAAPLTEGHSSPALALPPTAEKTAEDTGSLDDPAQIMKLWEPIRGLAVDMKPGSLNIGGGGSQMRRVYLRVKATDPSGHEVVFGVVRSAGYPDDTVFYIDSDEGASYLGWPAAPDIYKRWNIYITDTYDPGLGYRYQMWYGDILVREDYHVAARDQAYEWVSDVFGSNGSYTVDSSPAVFREAWLYKQTWVEWWDPYQRTTWYDDPNKSTVWEYHYQDPWALRWETRVLNMAYGAQKTANASYRSIFTALRPGSLNMNSSQSERHYAAAVVGQRTGSVTDSYVMFGVVRSNDNGQWRFFTYDNDDGWGYTYYGTTDSDTFTFIWVTIYDDFVAPYGYSYWVYIGGQPVRYGRTLYKSTYVTLEDQLWTGATTFSNADDTKMANFREPVLAQTDPWDWFAWNDGIPTETLYAPASRPIYSDRWIDPLFSEDIYRIQFWVGVSPHYYFDGVVNHQLPPNYGGRVTISWANPTLVDLDTVEWILSSSGDALVQVGWRKTRGKDSPAWQSPAGWLQYHTTSGEIRDLYSPDLIPENENIVALQFYDDVAELWRTEVSAPSWSQAWREDIDAGFGIATGFQLFGETSFLSDEIGGFGQSNAVQFGNIRYFSEPNQLGEMSPDFQTGHFYSGSPVYSWQRIDGANFKNWSNF